MDGEAVAFGKAVGFVAVGDVHGTFEDPDLLVDADVAGAAFESDAGARREFDFDELDGLGNVGWGDVAARVTGYSILRFAMRIASP